MSQERQLRVAYFTRTTIPLLLQVSMLDINDKQGVESCTNLQKEYSADDVMFTKVDVAKREQLVCKIHSDVSFYGDRMFPLMPLLEPRACLIAVINTT